MKVDIFLPTSNRIKALRNCLVSLNNQTDKNFKIFLVGLKKDKEVEKLAISFKNLNIDYFIQKKPGIISAANEALRKTQGEIFVRIDDDVVLDKDWFKNLIKTY
jgi:glycosyltransferase involved in cell wall biosynthesis